MRAPWLGDAPTCSLPSNPPSCTPTSSSLSCPFFLFLSPCLFLRPKCKYVFVSAHVYVIVHVALDPKPGGGVVRGGKPKAGQNGNAYVREFSCMNARWLMYTFLCQ